MFECSNVQMFKCSNVQMFNIRKTFVFLSEDPYIEHVFISNSYKSKKVILFLSSYQPIYGFRMCAGKPEKVRTCPFWWRQYGLV